MITNELLAAYAQTNFIVHAAKGDITIRVGNLHPTIDALIANEPIQEWAFITAYNPGSVILTKEQNEERQNKLKQKVIELNLLFIEGIGISDDKKWTDASIFIQGITLAKAKALGKEFGQNTIVYGKIREKATLIDCT